MKTLFSISFPALTLFVAGAWSLQHVQKSATHPVSDEYTATASAPKSSKMWAKTAVLYKGETIELHFAAPNAPYLGVVDPQGHFFYVVFPKETVVGNLKPLVESRRFASLQSLKINTRSLKADPYTYGVYTNQPVFTKSGTYTFILGENLHIDDPEFVEKLTVRYVHSRRPASTRPASSTDVAMN